MKIIVGLGNPGEEYELTRHNAGRIILDVVRKHFDGDEWENSSLYNALTSTIKVGKEKVLLLEPETFMNRSGDSIKKLIKTQKAAKDMVVIYDDLDLPVGKIKISFNKSSGGHKGLDSIIKQVKTLEFPRIRIGIDKGRNPEKHILGTFKDDELKTLKKLGKKIAEAMEVLVKDGWEKAASLYSNLEV